MSKEEFEIVKKIYETTKKEQSGSINFGITFEEDDEYDDDNLSVKVFKALYKCFKDKLIIPEISKYSKKVFDFFNNFNEANLYKNIIKNINKNDEIPKNEDSKEEKIFEEFKSTFNILKKDVKVNENNILNVLEKDIKIKK